jgi:hypothetical protein
MTDARTLRAQIKQHLASKKLRYAHGAVISDVPVFSAFMNGYMYAFAEVFDLLDAHEQARKGVLPCPTCDGVGWFSEIGVKEAAPRKDEDCCMSRHANAVPPWTCDCPCHTAPKDTEGHVCHACNGTGVTYD